MAFSEPAIQNAAKLYFEKLGFSTKEQYRIQIGSRSGITDIVIYKQSIWLSTHRRQPSRYKIVGPRSIVDIDPKHILAIVECKSEGKVEYGIDQLKSYLCATDVCLGVFANSISSHKWRYFENYGRSSIEEITLDRFKTLLSAKQITQAGIEHRIKKYTESLIEQEAKKRATESLIEERSKLIIAREAKKRATEFNVGSATEKLLKNEIANLKEMLRKRLIWSLVGWVSFIICLLIAAFSL